LSYYVRRRHLGGLGLLIIILIGILSIAKPSWFQNSVKTAEQNQPGLYSVNHFVDGDTIAINMNGSIETIRMIGIDTPETHKPNKPIQCYGPEAAAFTKKLIGGQSVRLKADSQDTNRDRYGRLLRYVYLPDGRIVESELIKSGYGFAYTLFPFEKKDEFTADMKAAQAAHKGLWTACQVHQETDGVYQTNNAS
jgi:endonuclease YncB( thermonuclease family)